MASKVARGGKFEGKTARLTNTGNRRKKNTAWRRSKNWEEGRISALEAPSCVGRIAGDGGFGVLSGSVCIEKRMRGTGIQISKRKLTVRETKQP